MPGKRALPLWLLLPLLVSVGAADETEKTKEEGEKQASQEAAVALKAASPEAGTTLYPKSRVVPVETTAPRFLFEVPALKAKDPLFFRVDLGETGGVPFFGALDRSGESEHHDRLYLDRNRDLDLTNDGEAVKARLRDVRTLDRTLVEFIDVRLDLPYRAESKSFTEPHRCVFFYYDKRKGEEQIVFQVERDGWREGRIEVGGKAYLLAVVDDDNNGIYTEGDTWALRPAELGRKDLLNADASRSLVYPSWSDDQAWTVETKGIDPAGRSLKVSIAKAEETEREYFVRIAARRQTEEERRLEIDPLRPKAGPTETIDWLRNETIRRALEIGEKVEKRVLIDFFAKDCQWCQRMDRHTYRDREVVSLAKRYVCIKVEHKEGAPASHKYAVQGTPTFVILDKDGTELARHAGFLRPARFATFLKRALR